MAIASSRLAGRGLAAEELADEARHVGKQSEPSTPLAFMSAMRASTS
jgi:hypothetical protein